MIEHGVDDLKGPFVKLSAHGENFGIFYLRLTVIFDDLPVFEFTAPSGEVTLHMMGDVFLYYYYSGGSTHNLQLECFQKPDPPLNFTGRFSRHD